MAPKDSNHNRGSEDDRLSSEAFEHLFRKHYSRVFGFARRRMLSRDAAEDAANEAFLVAWRRSAEIPAHALPWLLGVTRKIVSTRNRTERRKPVLPLDVDESRLGSSEDVAQQVVDREALAHAFAALNGGDQEVLRLSIWDGLGASDAGRLLGIPAAVFSVRLHRARTKLARELESNGHEMKDEVRYAKRS